MLQTFFSLMSLSYHSLTMPQGGVLAGNVMDILPVSLAPRWKFISLMSLPYHLLTTLPSVRPFRVVSSQEMLQKFFSLMPLPLSLVLQHQFHPLLSLG